jgi:uncharacterized protein YabN with tetrapyrrole methylase and pyrophosphatase domain
VRKGIEINEGVYQLIACYPFLMEEIEISEFSQFVKQNLVGVEFDFMKFQEFRDVLRTYIKEKKIGVEEFLILIRRENRISVIACRLVAKFPCILRLLASRVRKDRLETWMEEIINRDYRYSYDKIGMFSDKRVERIGVRIFLILVNRNNGISKRVCEVMVQFPNILDYISDTVGSSDIEQFIVKNFGGVEFDLARVRALKNYLPFQVSCDFSKKRIGEIGIERLVALMRQNSEIREEMCQMIVYFPFLVQLGEEIEVFPSWMLRYMGKGDDFLILVRRGNVRSEAMYRQIAHFNWTRIRSEKLKGKFRRLNFDINSVEMFPSLTLERVKQIEENKLLIIANKTDVVVGNVIDFLLEVGRFSLVE